MRVFNLSPGTHLSSSLQLFSISVWVIMTLQLCAFTHSLPCCTQQTTGSSSLQTSDHSSYRNTIWWLRLQTVEMFCLNKHTCQSRVIGDESVMGLWYYGLRQRTAACLHFNVCRRHENICFTRGFSLCFIFIDSCGVLTFLKNAETGKLPVFWMPIPCGAWLGAGGRPQNECVWRFSWMNCRARESQWWFGSSVMKSAGMH